MNISSWIFLGLLVAALASYILCHFKKFCLPEKALSLVISPFTAGLALSVLYGRIPDSLHIMILLSAASLTASAAAGVFIIGKNAGAKTAAAVVFDIHLLIWTELYRTTFYIFNVPAVYTAAAIPLLVLSAAALLVAAGKRSGKFRFMAMISAASAAVLVYTAVATLVLDPKLYSAILAAGSLAEASAVAGGILRKPEPIRQEKFFCLAANFTGQILLCAAGVLMVL